MQDINNVTITVRLTRDPELCTTNSGHSVGTLRVAVQRPGSKEDEGPGAAFYDVEVWNGTAENCAKFLSKGSRVAIVGRLEHQQWKDDKDLSHQRNYVVAGQVNFRDPAPKDEVGDDIPLSDSGGRRRRGRRPVDHGAARHCPGRRS
jgi:single-strand DNA-binding protein